MTTSLAVERQWNIRDAVLKWLYIRTAEGAHAPVPDVVDIMRVVDWEGEPIRKDEVAKATVHLRERGFIKGTAAMGAGVIRPIITADGELRAHRGISVSDSFDARVPANTTNNNIVVHGHATGAFSVGSANVTQKVDMPSPLSEHVRQFAELLLSHAADPALDEKEIRKLAADLQQASHTAEPDKAKLQRFIGQAIAAVSSSAAGTAVVSGAMSLLALL